MHDSWSSARHRLRSTLTGALLFSFAALFLGPLIGPHWMNPGVWFQGPDGSMDANIFWRLRLPQSTLAAVAGATLAIAGATFQALLRNPLATPYTLGVASGAAFGATLAIVLGVTTWLPHELGRNAFALCGAGLAVLIVFVFSRRRGALPGDTLILAGVTLNFFLGSLVMFIHCLANPMELVRMVRWSLGGLEPNGFLPVVRVLPFALGALWVALSKAADLNQLAGGEELAQSRGVDVQRTRRHVLLAVSLAIGVLVAETGPIGFVGLIVPHTVRRLCGVDHRILLPVCAVVGAGFLVICDAVARCLSTGVDLPVGVLTALLGGPFFLWVLGRGRTGLDGR